VSIREAMLNATPHGADAVGRRDGSPRLSIVLHTHMPYVEGFGTWPFGEEWLWEAIATSYLPLLDVFDAHPGKVTLSITPVLADQLEAPGAIERCLRFLREVRPASHELDLAEHPLPSLEYSAALYAAAADELERRSDLLAAFAPHVSWTSSATHAVLPLLATDAGVRLQIETGIAAHRRRFGAWGGGFWLPECAHAPWLDELLEEAGVHATCVDWSAVLGPGRRPPQRTQAGVLLVPLDREAMDRVWHPSGYPAHGEYRDSHRLTARAHRAWANDGLPYDPQRGAARAQEHAYEFVESLQGDTVVAFDTELFGHFWHEGPIWLRTVLELADVVPLDDALAEAVPAPADPPPTSWGEGRDLRTWSSGELAWTQRAAELAALGARPSPRVLRELLALQSSDWAFLRYHGTAGDYPRERAAGHHAAFTEALAGAADPALRSLAPALADWAFVQP
jgi:1,4-alpha-glucan branching enzyme